MDDCLIIGGGVIGLSLAYELAGHALRVRIIDRGQPGEEASWAGAGILPPAAMGAGCAPHEQLTSLSNELHRQWATELRELTGVDNGYRRCGALYLAHDAATKQSLQDALRLWHERGIDAKELSADQVAQREPSLAPVRWAVRLAEECQIRNPRHLRSLVAACLARGVQISPGVEAEEFLIQNTRVQGVRTVEGVLHAERYCITSGPWTRGLVERVGIRLLLKPVRGQMVLLQGEPMALRHIVNEGPRYLVPRGDGRVLVGSTEEAAGFDKRTTAAGVAGLLEFAFKLAPTLRNMQFERCWAGLRPATADGRPYLGPVPELDNVFVAAGHFRSGLQLSTGTARVMSQLLRGLPSQIDLSSFRLDRG